MYYLLLELQVSSNVLEYKQVGHQESHRSAFLVHETHGPQLSNRALTKVRKHRGSCKESPSCRC